MALFYWLWQSGWLCVDNISVYRSICLKWYTSHRLTKYSNYSFPCNGWFNTECTNTRQGSLELSPCAKTEYILVFYKWSQLKKKSTFFHFPMTLISVGNKQLPSWIIPITYICKVSKKNEDKCSKNEIVSKEWKYITLAKKSSCIATAAELTSWNCATKKHISFTITWQ